MPFVHPSTVLVAGPTGCGKTVFVCRVLKERGALVPEPERIVWVYSEWQEEYDDLKLQLPEIEFLSGINEDTYASFDRDKRNVLVLDDKMTESKNAALMEKLFTRGSHHRNVTVFYLVQNLYAKGAATRSINLNSHYYILFLNLQDPGQIEYLARRIRPRDKAFVMDAYDDATRTPHGYLVIDLRPDTPNDLRFRTSVFPGETLVVYKSKKV